MPVTIQIKRRIRKEPVTREDYMIRRLRKLGILPAGETPVFNLPKAPGVFSLGPEISPVYVDSEDEGTQAGELEITNLECMKKSMSGLF